MHYQIKDIHQKFLLSGLVDTGGRFQFLRMYEMALVFLNFPIKVATPRQRAVAFLSGKVTKFMLDGYTYRISNQAKGKSRTPFVDISMVKEETPIMPWYKLVGKIREDQFEKNIYRQCLLPIIDMILSMSWYSDLAEAKAIGDEFSLSFREYAVLVGIVYKVMDEVVTEEFVAEWIKKPNYFSEMIIKRRAEVPTSIRSVNTLAEDKERLC